MIITNSIIFFWTATENQVNPLKFWLLASIAIYNIESAEQEQRQFVSYFKTFNSLPLYMHGKQGRGHQGLFVLTNSFTSTRALHDYWAKTVPDKEVEPVGSTN